MSSDVLPRWVSVYSHNTPRKGRLAHTMILDTHNETVLTEFDFMGYTGG